MPPAGNTHSPSIQRRNKRPYQPPITSYFAPHDFGDSSGSDDERESGPYAQTRVSASRAKHQYQHLQQQQLQQQQQLPANVQANLLSVGMRVRKSVPEGYKTHKTMSLPSVQTTLTMSPNGTTMTTTQEYSVKPPREPVSAQVQHQRELLPFCGLQKIGGYAEQPVTNVHLYGGADASGERALNIFPLPAEAFSQPFSSQSSTSSSISNSSQAPNPANLHKRSWNDEEEAPARLSSNFLFKLPMKVSEDEVPISPLSATPPAGFGQAPLRPFAQPKTRRSALRTSEFDGIVFKDVDMDMDIENLDQVDARVVSGHTSDFDDAEFLQPRAAGREVHMSGI